MKNCKKMFSVCSQVKMGVQAIFGPSDHSLGAHIHSICDALDIPHLESRLDLDTGIKEFSINLYPAQTLLNNAFIDTMKFLNWTKVAIIYEQNYGKSLDYLVEFFKISILSSGQIKLRELMRTPDLEVIVRQADPQTYSSVLNEIKNKEIYNLIVDTNPEHINELLRGVSFVI